MLTAEQKKALDKACSLYLEARKTDDKATSLQLFNDAFGVLAEYIDEVDDIYYRVVLANCMEELQRKGNIDYDPSLIQFKSSIYAEMLTWFLKATEYNTEFRGHLSIAFSALARLLLLGEEGVSQNDHYAYLCYQCMKALGIPMVDELYLQDFDKDQTTGQWKFIGVKPQ